MELIDTTNITLNQITKDLNNLFSSSRIVLWYDENQEFELIINQLNDVGNLAGIEIIKVNNNEFYVKYLIFYDKPQLKFLIYINGQKPPPAKNWFLDLSAFYKEYSTDKASLILNELKIDYSFKSLITENINFFDDEKNKNSLSNLLNSSNETVNSFKLKMLAILCDKHDSSDINIENILLSLINEIYKNDAIDSSGRIFTKIIDCNLSNFFFQQLTERFNYNSDKPNLKDFIINLFDFAFKKMARIESVNNSNSDKLTLNENALVFFKTWRESRSHTDSYEYFALYFSEELEIADSILNFKLDNLAKIDICQCIDDAIISQLEQALTNYTIDMNSCLAIISFREKTTFYANKALIYNSLKYACLFLNLMAKNNFEQSLAIDSFKHGFDLYATTWYKIDQYYRKYLYYSDEAGEASLLKNLNTFIENTYVNNFLKPINDNWQLIIDNLNNNRVPDVFLQKDFIQHKILSILNKGHKVCVIISDALRFEVGEELCCIINAQKNYKAELENMQAMLPSYTQLGMAALLPNNELEIVDNESGDVLIDGKSTKGLEYRQKILTDFAQVNSKEGSNFSCRAIKYEDVVSLNSEETRSLVTENNLIYIYHNIIDSTGDKRSTEHKVFKTVEDCFKELFDLIKKLTAARSNKIYITSDHGFLYQRSKPDDLSFTTDTVTGNTILYIDRRFIIGKDLNENKDFKKFKASQLNLKGNIEVLFPKSIKRMPKKGSGMHFVHGGASLQELVIPLIMVKKDKNDEIGQVKIELFYQKSQFITTNQLAITFYQSEPISDKLKPRELKAVLLDKKNFEISDVFKFKFDFTSNQAKEREEAHVFMLNRKATELDNQEVKLIVEELIPGTSTYKLYREQSFITKVTFKSDFD